MKHNLLSAILNISATLILTVLIIVPVYFASHFSQVAGVRTESKYLLLSQTDKFPMMQFSQNGNYFSLTFQKQSESQAYLAVFILNNPTNTAKTYSIDIKSGQANIFFGEDLNNQKTSISVPPGVSVSISMVATNTILSNQVVSFEIN